MDNQLDIIGLSSSVTRLGNLLYFGQLFFGNNYFVQIAFI